MKNLSPSKLPRKMKTLENLGSVSWYGKRSKRGSFMVWEINVGVCPRLEFDNIMFINCLGYDFYIYGAFEFLCNSIANL